MGKLLDIEQLLNSLKSYQEKLAEEAIKALKLPIGVGELNNWIDEIEEQWEHSGHRFTIMLLGEFNAGKSTLLNALLNLPLDLQLPVGDDPTTAKPIRFSYIKGNPKASLKLKQHKLDEAKAAEEVEWSKALKAADETAEAKAQYNEKVAEIQLFYDHPLLEFTDIVDMPGTGTAITPEHTEITRNYLNIADMAIWVIGDKPPTVIGMEDFWLARNTKDLSLTVVFNAWGYLDEERDSELDIDQDELEQYTQENFPAAFTNDISVFTVYAQKCREAYYDPAADRTQDGPPVPDQFDRLRRFYDFLDDFVIGVQGRHEKVRLNARARVKVIARGAAIELDDALTKAAAKHSEFERRKSNLKEEREKQEIADIEGRIRNQINLIAASYAPIIVDYILVCVEKFIDDKVTPANLAFWFKKFSKEKLRIELERILKEEYLDLNQPNNWFEQQVTGFAADSLEVLDAEWRAFSYYEGIDISDVTGGSAREKLGFPTKTIREALLKTQNHVVKTLFTGVFAWLGRIITTILIPPLGVFLIADRLLGHHENKIETIKDKAIKHVQSEVKMQQTGVRSNLVEVIMQGPHKQQREKYEAKRREERATLSQEEQALEDWKVAIKGLQTIFNNYDKTTDIQGK